MKKNAKKILPIIGLMVLSGALAACGEDDREPGVLSIMFYNGGYGDEWVKEIADAYAAESGNMVDYVADSTIASKVEAQLTSKNSEYDIFISHDLNWQSYANRGLLANLDDVYNGETIDGDKFMDRVLPNAAQLSYFKSDKDGEAHYYKVCLTQGAGGFVYNADLFKEHGWEVPTTYAELTSLCAEIAEANIIPFAWAGGGDTRDYYWDYPLYEWWAELDGLDNLKTWSELKGKDGTYANGFDNFDPDGKFKNFKQAYKMWYDLVGTHPEYSNENAQGATLDSAQYLFYSGQAAMIPYGQWAKHEIKKSQGNKEFNFEVRMMKTPRVNATSDYYNFMVGFGDSMIVAKNSPNIEIAKDFLKFMASKLACRTFVEKAQGPFLAFDYSDIDMSDLCAKDSYVDSMYKILTETKNFTLSSNSPIITGNSDIDIQPWIGNNRYYKSCMANPSENTPDLVFEKVYNYARDNWRGYCLNAEVE